MTPGHDLSVLVVEDNATNQLAIGALLNRFGVSADFVPNGPKALAAVRAKQYRLVLMDLMLPGMDGFEAARQLRRLEYGTGRHTPVVAVTAVDPSISRNACIAAGMDGFVSKPIEPEVLEEVLKKWLVPATAAAWQASGALHVAQLLESFLKVTAQLLEDLNAAIRSGNLSAATHLAHEVKASSLVVSAGEVAERARRLEQAIRAERWGVVMDHYRDLVAAFHRTTEALKAPVQVIFERRPGPSMPRP